MQNILTYSTENIQAAVNSQKSSAKLGYIGQQLFAPCTTKAQKFAIFRPSGNFIPYMTDVSKHEVHTLHKVCHFRQSTYAGNR
jgi:hypothetical protein